MKHSWMGLLVAVMIWMGTTGELMAQMGTTVGLPSGEQMGVTERNAPRGDEALILYDRGFGERTRTNPYGVEVIAVPVPGGDSTHYEVTQMTSVWECQKQGTLDACGDAAIPANGIVLSATGKKREALKVLKPGDIITVRTEWTTRQNAAISVVNPTPLTNPIGSGFPGYRASNQLIVYDAGYGRPTTGTNEFGFEVTVRNGIVVAQEGSDSAIPPDGFVLSGHGNARSWLIANAPLGAKIQRGPDDRHVTSVIDFETYQYQFDRQWAQSPCAQPSAVSDAMCRTIHDRYREALALADCQDLAQAIPMLLEAKENLSRRQWLAYEAFPADALKGVWVRPTETTRDAVGKTLDRLKAAGLNAVFLETYFHGYTIFPSHTFQAYGLPAQNPKFQGVDLLQLWTEEAHRRQMTVHVWFQTFYAGTKAYKPPGPVLEKYPQWANVQYVTLKPAAVCDSTPATSSPASDCAPQSLLLSPTSPVPSNLETGAYFLDPANPEVQAFLLKLVDEIATRYPIDGFQLDYIRYPASFPPDRFSYHKTTWGYTPVARQAFQARYGVDPAMLDPKKQEDAALWKAWGDFKAEQVSRFVERATSMLRQKHPKVRISAAVFPNPEDSLALKHQDWLTWAQKGWVDFLAPMTLTSAVKVVGADTERMVRFTGGKVPVTSGIFGPFNNNTADHVLEQIDAARKAGASGFVVFDAAHLTPRMQEALSTAHTPRMPAPSVSPPVPETGTVPAAKKRRWFKRK